MKKRSLLVVLVSLTCLIACRPSHEEVLIDVYSSYLPGTWEIKSATVWYHDSSFVAQDLIGLEFTITTDSVLFDRPTLENYIGTQPPILKSEYFLYTSGARNDVTIDLSSSGGFWSSSPGTIDAFRLTEGRAQFAWLYSGSPTRRIDMEVHRVP